MKTYEFPSSSNPNQKHTVSLNNGILSCSCRGFRTPNKCWHVRKIAEQEGLIMDSGSSVAGFVSSEPKQDSLLSGISSSEEEIPIKPMLARGLKEEESLSDFSSADYWLEEKYNGHRIIIENAAELTAWSRAGNIRQLPSHIVNTFSKLPKGIYDGELYIPGGQSTDVKAIQLQHQLELVLFDIMQLENASTINFPLFTRRGFLQEATRELITTDSIYLSSRYDPYLSELQKIWDRGGEGAILKHKDSLYEVEKRSKLWIKFKKEISEVGTITGFEPGLLGPYSKVQALDKYGVEVQVKMLNDEWRAKLEREGGAKYIGAKLRFNHQGRTRDKKKFLHPMMDHIFVE